MKIDIRKVEPSDQLWPSVEECFPRAVKWMNDPKDDGHYHFFAAVDDQGEMVGGSVIDIGDLRFGPLSKMTIGFLEDIEVDEEYQRKRVGTALLRAVLQYAWDAGAQNVRWTVDWKDEAAIALYKSQGVAFVPEGKDTEHPEKYYTMVAVNPNLMQAGYACQPTVLQRRGKPRA